MTVRHAASLIAISSLVVIAASGALGYALRPVPEPELLSPGAGETSAPVVAQTFDDSRRVQVRLVTGPERNVVAQSSGTLTASWCRDGAGITSGSVVAHVDERPVIALHTTVPLYRDISGGDEGADVAAVQSELARLGFLDAVDVDGTFGRRTGHALQKLREHLGRDAGERRVAREEFLWLPAPELSAVTCTVKVGDPVSSGSTIATSRGAVERVEVQSLPGDLTPGDRAISIGSARGTVDAGGVTTDPAFLAELGSSADLLAGIAQDPDTTFTATIALATPLDAYTIPAGALIGTDRDRCVRTVEGIVHAHLLGASLGSAVVTFADAECVPESVMIGADLNGERCE